MAGDPVHRGQDGVHGGVAPSVGAASGARWRPSPYCHHRALPGVDWAGILASDRAGNERWTLDRQIRRGVRAPRIAYGKRSVAARTGRHRRSGRTEHLDRILVVVVRGRRLLAVAVRVEDRGNHGVGAWTESRRRDIKPPAEGSRTITTAGRLGRVLQAVAVYCDDRVFNLIERVAAGDLNRGVRAREVHAGARCEIDRQRHGRSHRTRSRSQEGPDEDDGTDGCSSTNE